MSLIIHHTTDAVCALCEDKLSHAVPSIADWFRAVKAKNPNVHVACSTRGQKEQEDAFNEGRSQLHFPRSEHNTDPSKALDIFQINDQGHAYWDPVFLAGLNQENKLKGLDIKWGGEWRSLGDGDHFQVDS